VTAAVDSYVADVLSLRPDEQAILGFTPTEIESDESTGELEIAVAAPDREADAQPDGKPDAQPDGEPDVQLDGDDEARVVG